jgi:excisionase family DNA binding protein
LSPTPTSLTIPNACSTVWTRPLADRRNHHAHLLHLVTEDNRHEMISIPPGAVRLFVDILTQLGQGRAVTIVPGKVELTTQDVADYLNVSRPYVVKLIESGKLPARLVGTRRRVSFADLIKFDEDDRKARRAALDELAQIDQELNL